MLSTLSVCQVATVVVRLSTPTIEQFHGMTSWCNMFIIRILEPRWAPRCTRFQDGKPSRAPKFILGLLSDGHRVHIELPWHAAMPAHISCSHYCSCGALGRQKRENISGAGSRVRRARWCGTHMFYGPRLFYLHNLIRSGRKIESHGVCQCGVRRPDGGGWSKTRWMVPSLI